MRLAASLYEHDDTQALVEMLNDGKIAVTDATHPIVVTGVSGVITFRFVGSYHTYYTTPAPLSNSARVTQLSVSYSHNPMPLQDFISESRSREV